ncbi:RNA-binding cell elongation regulator Jag/EloR [Chloroflexota bacterium]
MEKLGVSREEIRITVLKESKHGILGLGAEEARIRVEPLITKPTKSNDIAKLAKDVLEALLARMGIIVSVALQAPSPDEIETDATTITLNIIGDDLGILIGRRGQTLACLQYVVRLIVAKQTNTWLPVVVDVQGYKQRRREALQTLAWRIAEQVKTNRSSFSLEPMPAYERRIIHLTLVDHNDITTESIGEGEARKVVILLRER